MVRLACILAALLWVTPQQEPEDPCIEQELAALIEKTNALESFHLVYDTKGPGKERPKTFEFIYRAPGLARVRASHSRLRRIVAAAASWMLSSPNRSVSRSIESEYSSNNNKHITCLFVRMIFKHRYPEIRIESREKWQPSFANTSATMFQTDNPPSPSTSGLSRSRPAPAPKPQTGQASNLLRVNTNTPSRAPDSQARVARSPSRPTTSGA